MVFVVYGILLRIVEGVVRDVRVKGMKLGLIRLKILWFYLRKVFKKLSDLLKGFVIVEMNMMV